MDQKVLLSLKNVEVKFNVRGRILTAIRNVSLDIYENESLAIVGESGSGKSVLTKTFAGMLDSNGFISNGSVIFYDDELIDTVVKLTPSAQKAITRMEQKLDGYAPLQHGAETYKSILELKAEKKRRPSAKRKRENSAKNSAITTMRPWSCRTSLKHLIRRMRKI